MLASEMGKDSYMLELLLAGALATGTPADPPAPPAPAKPLSAQAAFNAATAAQESRNYAEAVAMFEALETRPGMDHNSQVMGIILIRKGLSLLEIERLSDAWNAIEQGLSLVRTDNPTLRADLYMGRMGLGRIALLRYATAQAMAEFTIADTLAVDPADHIRAKLNMVRATMFDADDTAVRMADQALVLAKATPGIAKDDLASVLTIRALALMNHGRVRDAYAELQQALSKQGGLTSRTNVSEAQTRSDLAIAALLNGNKDEARKYMAYTGAGRIEEAPFRGARSLAPPSCDIDADLRPEDSVVVEFNIRKDGTVGYATPIYASRLGPGAQAMARAILAWSWRPEDVSKIPLFYRIVTRIELRCSTGTSRPATVNLLQQDALRWLAAAGAKPVQIEQSEGASLAPLRAELAARNAAGGGVATIPVLVALGNNSVAAIADRVAWLTHARNIAIATSAPATVRTWLETLVILASWDFDHINDYRAALRALIAEPAIAADARAAGVVRLMIAEPRFRSPPPPDAIALVTQVATDSRLVGNDPLRVGALVRLAALNVAAGNVAAAREAYTRTGLSEQQCALLDAQPALLKTHVGSNDYPLEALSWGFEGWVRVEYDITAEGRTTQPRAIIAYPPFVFRDAAVGMARAFRYSQSYRPGGSAGCSGEQQGINFSIPR
jgi:tetratricopeptide (TPR) repeat protein